MNKGLYPIRTISAMTGINPVTLRAWERRYGLIKPQRTPKGHRLYTREDIERIQHILALMERGIPISQARQVLDDAGATPRTSTVTSPQPTQADGMGNWEQHCDNWRKALQTFDEHALSDACDDSLSLFPLDVVIARLVRPLLQELEAQAAQGVAPNSNLNSNPDAVPDAGQRAQRHFLQAFVRNKLGARFIHGAGRSAGPRLLLACPAGGTDDLELLLLGICAQSYGYRVVLLGIDVDHQTLLAAMKASRCAGLVLASHGKRPPRGLLPALQALSAPVFLLGPAGQWPAMDAAHLVAAPDISTALRCIGQRLPAAAADDQRPISQTDQSEQTDHSGAV